MRSVAVLLLISDVSTVRLLLGDVQWMIQSDRGVSNHQISVNGVVKRQTVMVVETRSPQIWSRVLRKCVESIRGIMWVSVSRRRKVSLSDCRFLGLRNLRVSLGRPNVVDWMLLVLVQLLKL